MSNGTTPGEVPIIIQGGNSVHVNLPDDFEEDGNPGKKGGKFGHKNHHLLRITVDGKPVEVELKKDSEIVIYCGTRK